MVQRILSCQLPSESYRVFTRKIAARQEETLGAPFPLISFQKKKKEKFAVELTPGFYLI